MAEKNFTIEGRKFPSMPDPQRSWMWELFIPNIQILPIIPKINFDEDDFIVRCRSTSIPSGGFEHYEANYLGFKKLIPVKKKITNVITTEIEEFEDQKVLKFVYGWMNIIIDQNPKSLFVGHMQPTVIARNIYTRNIVLNMYKFSGDKLSRSIIFHNAWPLNMGDVTLNYADSGTVKYSVEWAFDNWTLGD
jgi:hypothetical protein